MKQIEYSKARRMMLPGDLLAFGGSGYVSEIIKSSTDSNVSHVGVILQTSIPSLEGIFINQIIESVGKKKAGEAGVVINRISDHIRDYDGDIWWLPLLSKFRIRFNQGIFFSFMLDQIGKPYDLPQAIGSALDFIPDNLEDLDKLYCSELVSAGYEKIGFTEPINCSEQTPIDTCRFNFLDSPFQLKGELKELY